MRDKQKKQVQNSQAIASRWVTVSLGYTRTQFSESGYSLICWVAAEERNHQMHLTRHRDWQNQAHGRIHLKPTRRYFLILYKTTKETRNQYSSVFVFFLNHPTLWCIHLPRQTQHLQYSFQWTISRSNKSAQVQYVNEYIISIKSRFPLWAKTV